MTQIISDIVNAFKRMIAELEKIGRDVIDQVAKESEVAAQKLLVLLKSAFNDIKARISQLIKMMKARWNALTAKRIDSSPGQTASSFSQRLRQKAQEVERRAEAIMSDLRSSATAMVEEAKAMFKRLSDSMGTAAGDMTADLRKGGEDLFRELVTIGEGAVKKMKSFAESAFKDIEVDGSFAFKHSLQIAEAATISVINPLIVVSLGLSAGILIGAHHYAEGIQNETTQGAAM